MDLNKLKFQLEDLVANQYMVGLTESQTIEHVTYHSKELIDQVMRLT